MNNQYKKRTLNYDFLNCAKHMPPLPHSTNNDSFDIMKSQVAEWLCSQPEIRQKIFNMAHNKNAIVYDPATRMWKGADYDGH